jgi:hypothetical protein
MKIHFITFLLIILFGACEKDEPAHKYPPQDKEWFKNLQTPCDENTVCKLRINKALYESDTVYYSTFVGALCDMFFTVSLLNVDGDTIKSYIGPYEADSFYNEVLFIETLYRCEDSQSTMP